MPDADLLAAVAKPLARLPLTVTATGTGQRTDGMLVGVMAADLDAVEAERDRLAAALADATGKIAAGITVCDETEWAASVVWNYGQGVAAEQGRRVREALTDESAA